MKTIVSVPHHEYSARVRTSVENRLQQLLHFHDRIHSVRALLEKEGDRHRVELVAHVGHGVTLVVDSRGEHLDPTVDQARDKMARLLVRHKERLLQRHRRGNRGGR